MAPNVRIGSDKAVKATLASLRRLTAALTTRPGLCGRLGKFLLRCSAR